MTGRGNTNQRAGVTLLEVLTAMFIMAIGMLALLTLFPLGALNMAQALKDDRAASAAHNAANLAAATTLRQDANVTPWYTMNVNPTAGAVNTPLPPSYTGPAFPVFVDAYGFGIGDIQDTNGNSVIKRVSPTYVVTPANWDPPQGPGAANASGVQDRWFSLLDDLTFTTSGVPDLPPGGTVERAGKFTWAYLLQPVSAANTSSVNSPISMSVVVYWGRNIGSLTVEPAATGSGTAGNTSITITNNLTGAQLPRRGGWILDTTPNPTVPQGFTQGVPQGYFYQVINIDPSGTTIDVQPALIANVSSFVIMNDVHFVANKGTSQYP